MNGRIARAIRKVTGFKPNQGRDYKPVIAAYDQKLVIDKEESAKRGETRLRIHKTPKITIFQNDAARAVYRQTKKDYTKGEIK